MVPTRIVSDDVWFKNSTAHPNTTGVFTVFAVRATTDWWARIANVSEKGNGQVARNTRRVRWPSRHRIPNEPYGKEIFTSSPTADIVADYCAIGVQDNDACPAVPDTTGQPMPVFPYNTNFAYPRQVEDKIGKHALQCVAKIQVSIDTCSSCCCRDGYIKAETKSALVIRNIPNCPSWFSTTVDGPIRLVANLLRMIILMRQFPEPCFENGRDKQALFGTYVTDIFKHVQKKRASVYNETTDYGWKKAKRKFGGRSPAVGRGAGVG